jgi:hypothetical protein
MPGVFISYRKDDTRPWAIHLRDHLVQVFGERQVFFDVDSIAAGQWRNQIDRALDRCAVLLVLIGQRWTGAVDAAGRRRLLLADDVHRHEVASALTRPGVTVIPVLVDGARLPQASDLPDDVRGILDCQSTEIVDAPDVRAASLRRLTRLIDARIGQGRVRLHAAATAAATLAAAVVNTMVVSTSPLAAALFLLVASSLGVLSFTIYRRMARGEMKGAWVALAAVALSLAMLVGSLARLTFALTQAGVVA